MQRTEAVHLEQSFETETDRDYVHKALMVPSLAHSLHNAMSKLGAYSSCARSWIQYSSLY